MSRRPTRLVGLSWLGGLALLGAIALTAPPEVHAEPLEAVAGTPVRRGRPPLSLVAATPRTAAVVTDDHGKLRFRFVDPAGGTITTWRSHRSRAPRVVCTACPRPLVGDVDGYYRWSGSAWKPMRIDAMPSSLDDPLASIFGVIQETGTRTSLSLLVGRDGRYRLVHDGGDRFSSSSTGLEPEAGGYIDLAGGPGQSAAPLAIVRDPDGSVLSLQADTLAPDGRSVLTRNSPKRSDSVVVRAGSSPAGANSAPCLRTTASTKRAIAISSQLVGDASQAPPPFTIIWLSASLRETARARIQGFYDHCAVLPDGSVWAWTGTTAGASAVDVAIAWPNGKLRTGVVPIADDTLTSTALQRGTRPSLLAWPLGGHAVRIDQRFATHQLAPLGGSQELRDDEGGTWVSFPAIGLVHRYEPESAP